MLAARPAPPPDAPSPDAPLAGVLAAFAALSVIWGSTDLALRFEQHNSEGGLVEALHGADTVETAGVVLNAAGYSHTSVVLRDAIAAIRTPVLEVHLSNTAAREAFRHHSVISAVCAGTITGLGPAGYRLAVQYFADKT